jgi:hypothetical protein
MSFSSPPDRLGRPLRNRNTSGSTQLVLAAAIAGVAVRRIPSTSGAKSRWAPTWTVSVRALGDRRPGMDGVAGKSICQGDRNGEHAASPRSSCRDRSRGLPGRSWSQVVAGTSGLPANVVVVWSQLDDPTASSDPATGPLSCDFGCAPPEIRTPNRQIRSLVTVRSCPGSGGAARVVGVKTSSNSGAQPQSSIGSASKSGTGLPHHVRTRTSPMTTPGPGAIA